MKTTVPSTWEYCLTCYLLLCLGNYGSAEGQHASLGHLDAYHKTSVSEKGKLLLVILL